MSEHTETESSAESAPSGGERSDGHSAAVATDGGAATGEELSDVEREQQIDYLDVEINLLKPATPFMRDHLRIIWTGFIIWTFTTFGPITLTRLAPDTMTSTMPVLEFPLHYFLIAVVGPTAALLLSVWYARKRDQIDEKYGIEQPTPDAPTTETADEDVAAADGGVRE
jgi:putative solute:sodium symporter small subunit